jgi:hypothetical protein
MTTTATTSSSATNTNKPSTTTLSWIKRQATNLFILSILVLFTIDVAPFEILQDLQAGIDSFLDITGLWQGPYYLFCPDVDKENIRLSAWITYKNNKNVTATSKNKTRELLIWQTPDWTTMSPFQKKRHFRQIEYYDNIRLDDNQALWKPLAQHLVQKFIYQQLQKERAVLPIAQIELVRHWTMINPPPETTGFWDKVELDFQPEGSYPFYTLHYL